MRPSCAGSCIFFSFIFPHVWSWEKCNAPPQYDVECRQVQTSTIKCRKIKLFLSCRKSLHLQDEKELEAEMNSSFHAFTEQDNVRRRGKDTHCLYSRDLPQHIGCKRMHASFSPFSFPLINCCRLISTQTRPDPDQERPGPLARGDASAMSTVFGASITEIAEIAGLCVSYYYAFSFLFSLISSLTSVFSPHSFGSIVRSPSRWERLFWYFQPWPAYFSPLFFVLLYFLLLFISAI